MKRLFASALAVLFCLSLCVVILYADPGDNPPPNGNCPPPPPGYEGLWPPDEMYSTSSDSGDGGTDDPTDTLENGGGLPWGDPNQ
jgi:hypothetical protein